MTKIKVSIIEILFTIIYLLSFIPSGYCAPLSGNPEPDRIVCLYGRPLHDNDVGAVMSGIAGRDYSSSIQTSLFLPGTSVWLFIPYSILRNDKTRKYLVTGYQDGIDVFQRKGKQWKKIKKAGKYASFPAGALKERYFVKLFDAFPADTSSAFLVVCRKNNNYFFSDLQADLKSEAQLAAWHSAFMASADAYPKLTLPFFGIAFTTIILLLVKFFLSHDRAYSFHAVGHILFP
ncbi:hypothetical protein [Dyadobacter aurulentus]|uniref:hypothetical protein n=1 Tax=Dyadobacter sp. UC 10 TaxID=2605428 RepID=UPI0011F2EE14|nr:hypothetical protein [Dyadobacter sp. UC 10]KAA0992057.1 hypothetical protein FXO21_18700 [Dyadobacter sp. UC 10]